MGLSRNILSKNMPTLGTGCTDSFAIKCLSLYACVFCFQHFSTVIRVMSDDNSTHINPKSCSPSVLVCLCACARVSVCGRESGGGGGASKLQAPLVVKSLDHNMRLVMKTSQLSPTPLLETRTHSPLMDCDVLSWGVRL